MKTKNSRIAILRGKFVVFTFTSSLAISATIAQTQVATPSPTPQAAPQKETTKPAPANSTITMPSNNQGPSKEDMEQRKKMAELNKQIQEAEKAGNGATPEIAVKKEELKKLQEQLRAKMMAENEKRRKENEANATKNNEANQKIIQLTKEIKEAEASGKAESQEIIAKKAELKKLQDAVAERESKAKAEREQMMKNRLQPSPEDMEANKKMGQLSKEIRDAEKEGKGESPEVVAKKAELKKMQEIRITKMKAEREKAKVEQTKTNGAEQKNDAKPEAPVKEEKK
jgi:hypothetical protein